MIIFTSAPSSGADYSEYRTETYGAPTHYCDPTRSLASSGAGTLGDPWNLTQAAANAVAGNVVGIMAGVGVDMPTTGSDNFPAFNPSNSGTSTDRIVYVTQYAAVALSSVETNGNRTEFRHDGTAPGISGGSGTGDGCAMLGSNGRDFITYDGFYIDMAQAYMQEDSGVLRAESCEGVHFRNFVIKGAALTVASNPVIYRPDNALDTVLSNFRAYDFTNDGTGSSTPQAALFSDQYGDQNVLIEHFHIDNTQRGIFFKGTAVSATVFNYGTIQYGIVSNVRSAYQFNDLDATNPTVLQYCLAYNIGQEGEGDGGIVLSSETSAARNITIHHCTVAKVDAASINTEAALLTRSNGIGSSVVIRDCILDGDNGARGHAVSLLTQLPATLDYNFYYKNGGTESYVFNGSQYNSFASWQAAVSGRDANSIEGATSPFTDRAGDDYTVSGGHAAKTGSSTGGEMGCYATSETIGVLA